MLRQGKLDAAMSAQGPPLPTLAKVPLPIDELTQLQRRLAHLLTSLAELQDHVANAVSLEEWPWLLSRHVALVSQTHSLSLVLSRANPTALHAQLTRFEEALLDDARNHNKFSAGDDAEQAGAQALGSGGDALFGGRADAPAQGASEAASTSQVRLPNVQYSDGDDNPLRRLAPHPFSPLDATKSQTVIPSLLLPRGIDSQVTEETQLRWEAWLRENAGNLGLNGIDDKSNSETLARIVVATLPASKQQWLRHARQQIYDYDSYAQKAQVSFVHAREATDEFGQRYDWRLRLGADDDSDDEGEGAEQVDTVAADEFEDAADDAQETVTTDALVMTDALGMPIDLSAPDIPRKREITPDQDTKRKAAQSNKDQPLTLANVTSLLQTGQY